MICKYLYGSQKVFITFFNDQMYPNGYNFKKLQFP